MKRKGLDSRACALKCKSGLLPYGDNLFEGFVGGHVDSVCSDCERPRDYESLAMSIVSAFAVRLILTLRRTEDHAERRKLRL